MMQRSNRGAARVPAIWMILVFVLFLASTFLAYTAGDARTKAQGEAAAAVTAKEEADAARMTELARSRNITEVLGYYNREDMQARSDVEQAKQGLSEFKSSFPGMTDAEGTWEEAWPKASAAYRDSLGKVKTLEAQIEDLRNQVSAANAATSSVTSSKDQKIRELEQQLADAQTNAQDERNELERQLSAARNQFSSADSSWKAAQAELADEKRARELDANAARTRTAALTRTLAEQTGLTKEIQGPDGSVLATSASLGIAWIDLGAGDRVSLGMRFDVTSGKPGATDRKGVLEVTKVEPERAECRVVDLADEFDPIVGGDTISNPIYVAGGTRNAVMAGRFSGTWNESELKVLLGEIGIDVQDAMDKSTAFLVVGDPLYNDPDTGEVLEEPMAVSEMAIYKDAEAAGLTIVSIEDIRRFFVK